MNYETEILPLIERIFKQKSKKVYLYIFGGVILCLLMFIFISHLILTDKNIFVFILCVILSFFITRQRFKNNIIKLIKNETFGILAKSLNLEYKKNNITSDLIKFSGAFGYFENCKKEDDFFMQNDKNSISFSQISLSYETYNTVDDKDTTTRTVPVFDGLVVMFEFKNNILHSHTVLIPNRYKPNIKKLVKTELESVEFEKEFDVWTNDEVEARVILNPVFMEKLTALKDFFGLSGVCCSFYSNIVLIGLPTKSNLFEISYKNDLAHYKNEFEKIIKELKAIIELNEYLNIKFLS